MAKRKVVCLEQNLRQEIEEVRFIGGEINFQLLYKLAREEIKHAEWGKKTYRKNKYSDQFDTVIKSLAKEFLNLSESATTKELKNCGAEYSYERPRIVRNEYNRLRRNR